MRKIVYLILILGIAFSIGLIVSPSPKLKNVPKEIRSLPAINLLLTDSQTVINTSTAAKGKAIVIFYFDPGCSHCQDETVDILTNHDILKNANIYFISLDSMKRIRDYMEHYQLNKYSEIIVAKDYQFNSLKTFKIESIPTNIVYNRKHEIAKIFIGGMTVKDLKIILKGS